MDDLLERAGRALVANPPVEATAVDILRGRLRRRRRRHHLAMMALPALFASGLVVYAVASAPGTARSIRPSAITDPVPSRRVAVVSDSTRDPLPLHGTSVEVTGHHVGDTAGPSTRSPDDWFTANSELVEALVPEWIAVLSDDRVVVGYVKGIEFVGLVGEPLPIYDEGGAVISHYGDDGRPALDLLTPDADTGPKLPVGDGSMICIAGDYTIVSGDTPREVAQSLGVSIEWLDFANADTRGYAAFYVGLVIKVPTTC